MGKANRPRWWTIRLLCVFIFPFLVSCGPDPAGNAADQSFEKIFDPGRTLTIVDVEAAGWKHGKTYDVVGLDGAEAAYLGFWTPPDQGSLNYEIRVYPSHDAAVKFGIPFAVDASGDSAVLDAEDAMWAEGVQDRRMIVGGGSRGSQNPRYGDYVILGNLVILCEGRTSQHSLDQCAPFVSLINEKGA